MSLVQSNEYVEQLNFWSNNLLKKYTQSNYQNSRAKESVDNTKNEKWYKSGVFWIALGSIATIIAFITSIFMSDFFK